MKMFPHLEPFQLDLCASHTQDIIWLTSPEIYHVIIEMYV